MKELSIEEKARNYDEAIERVDDEKIRQSLINEVTETSDEIMSYRNMNKKDVLAWLEKQGKLMKALQISNSRIAELVEEKYNLEEKLKKQGKNNMGISETTKQELEDKLNKALKKETPESLNEFLDENPADKVKPKFKVGDWVVYENRVGLIIRMLKEHYIISFDGVEEQVSFIFNDRIAKWTIQDAKDGDVLANDTIVLIVDHLGTFENRPIIYSWYFADSNKFYGMGPSEPDRWEVGGFHPATKKQCKLLFQKMHEAGYEWDAEKKELKKEEEVYNLHNYLYGKQDPVWSEEDETKIKSIIAFLKSPALCAMDSNKGIIDESIKYLKSIEDRVQPKQGLSEEDEKTIRDAIFYFKSSKKYDDKLIEYINEERNKKGFLFNGEEASWNEIPLNVRKHDYPYYFKGELDCFPFTP